MPNLAVPAGGWPDIVGKSCVVLAASKGLSLALWQVVGREFGDAAGARRAGIRQHHDDKPAFGCLPACELYFKFFLKNAVIRAHASVAASGRYPSLLLGFSKACPAPS